jgi:hypothetical protein
MRTLSKSKLLAFRQCPKRLWLEIHHPELRDDSSATQASFDVGHQVGHIARQLYDPRGKGAVLDPQAEGFDAAFTRTQSLLQSRQPIFEAGFNAEGAMAFADVMMPVKKSGLKAWRMVEVKSSTKVKDYYSDDVAVQAFIARAAGVPLASIALAHIDNTWVYPGNGDYQGLLVENDLTEEAFGRADEVRDWISAAQGIVAKRNAPAIATGKQCSVPYDCGFIAHCQRQEPEAEHPIHWLKGKLTKELASKIEVDGLIELRDLPNALLSQIQLRIKNASLSGKPHFDKRGAALALGAHKLPAYFMDFETIQFAVPIWKGTRPYQKMPFQFSVHRLSRTSKLEHESFLDLSGKDPAKAFAEALIAACGERGPIFVYSAPFEMSRIRELAVRFPRLAAPLLAINTRIVDLLPIAREYYYHPSQQGSWSIKAVLPALCPDLTYDDLDGVQDGGMTMEAYMEAISPQTNTERKAAIKRQLLAYCTLDTFAMVRMWSAFTGNKLKN